MKLNIYQVISVVFLFVLIIFWIFLNSSHTTTGMLNYTYSFLFGLIPLLGGLVAIINSKIWGGLKSSVGKAVFFIGLGLFCWGSGETVWSYFNFFKGVAAPYPSIADVGFAPSIFFYGLGTIYLSSATGAKYGLRSKAAKILVALITIATMLVAYYVIVIVARGGVLIPPGEDIIKTILDVAYPLGDLLAFVIAAIISGLSFKYLGGEYRIDTYSILIGLVVMFIADSVFSYSTTAGTYFNGDWGDLLLTVGLFFLTFGVLGFCAKVKNK